MIKQILIVEDNEDNSLLVEKILTYYGFGTAVALNGKSALDYCALHQPDLILMDLSLPDMDGIEVARLLRKNTRYQQVPMIALTANTMRGIQERAQEAGLNAFLTKPILPSDLILLIRSYLKT